MMKVAECEAWRIEIYVSGRYDDILRCLQQQAIRGACYSIQPTDYVFTYGAEAGAKITLINYARFPQQIDVAEKDALKLAECLILHTGMGSASVVTPTTSYFISRRGDIEDAG